MPEQLYRKLGCKLAVGMPFKDIATSDTLYLPRVPPADDKEARRALIRLQVGQQHNRSAFEGPANALFAVWLTSGPADVSPPAPSNQATLQDRTCSHLLLLAFQDASALPVHASVA